MENEDYFYHTNEHGDVTYLSNIAGEIENSYSYDVFGNIREQKENIENIFKYAGEQLDKETEQYYLRARYYNPTIGRFTQEDVYRGDGLNLYTYVINNPLLWIDPSGYAKCSNHSKPTKKTGADTLPNNIVQRGIKPDEIASIEAGNGIQKPIPAHRTTPTQHIGGVKHSRDPYTSTMRSSDTANYYASHDKNGVPLDTPNPIITIDLNKINPSNIVDVSTTMKANETLTTPFARHAAAADQEVLIKGDIPQEAIIEYKK